MEKKTLTVLAFGGGQDSTAILYKFALEPTFREKWAPGDLIVIISDTGNEHPHTYKHISFIHDFCRLHRIEFYFIDHTQGYHPRTWPTLQAQFKANSTVMSMAYPKTCTDNLKIKPLYNFLDHYIARRYFNYIDKEAPKGKKYIKRFACEHGKINVLLGIASGEESRIAKDKKRSQKKLQLELFAKVKTPVKTFMDTSIQKLYPLIELGMDRQACQDYIRSFELPLPYPSNCIFCPFANKVEILWLYRFYPELFRQWVHFEQRKLQKSDDKGVHRNLGVKGEKTLEMILSEAISEFGHMTDAELDHYKMSHGHCVKSSY